MIKSHWHLPIAGFFYVAFTILFAVVVTLTFWTLFDCFLKEKAKDRKADYQRLFIANLYGFLTGSISFLPVYGIQLYQYNLLIMPLWQFLLAYTMVRYELMTIEGIVEATQKEKLATIGTLAASINHEIRNPLYIVKGLLESHIENIKEGFQIKEPLQTSQKALSQVNRALEVITKLNRFSKPVDHKILENDKASPAEVIETVLDLISYEFKLGNIKINNQIDPNIPHIQADQRQLEEIFFNLIVNACHAIPNGGELQIRSVIYGTRITVEIKDTGSGISQDQMKHLFEPFYTTKGDKGTGLGLYITKQLVERNGGKISVSSKPNQGTLFTLEFKTT